MDVSDRTQSPHAMTTRAVFNSKSEWLKVKKKVLEEASYTAVRPRMQVIQYQKHRPAPQLKLYSKDSRGTGGGPSTYLSNLSPQENLNIMNASRGPAGFHSQSKHHCLVLDVLGTVFMQIARILPLNLIVFPRSSRVTHVVPKVFCQWLMC